MQAVWPCHDRFVVKNRKVDEEAIVVGGGHGTYALIHIKPTSIRLLQYPSKAEPFHNVRLEWRQRYQSEERAAVRTRLHGFVRASKLSTPAIAASMTDP